MRSTKGWRDPPPQPPPCRRGGSRPPARTSRKEKRPGVLLPPQGCVPKGPRPAAVSLWPKDRDSAQGKEHPERPFFLVSGQPGVWSGATVKTDGPHRLCPPHRLRTLRAGWPDLGGRATAVRHRAGDAIRGGGGGCSPLPTQAAVCRTLVVRWRGGPRGHVSLRHVPADGGGVFAVSTSHPRMIPARPPKAPLSFSPPSPPLSYSRGGHPRNHDEY